MTWLAIKAFLGGVGMRTWLIVGGIALVVIGLLTARAVWVKSGARKLADALNKDFQKAREKQDDDAQDIDRMPDSDLDDELRQR